MYEIGKRSSSRISFRRSLPTVLQWPPGRVEGRIARTNRRNVPLPLRGNCMQIVSPIKRFETFARLYREISVFGTNPRLFIFRRRD